MVIIHSCRSISCSSALTETSPYRRWEQTEIPTSRQCTVTEGLLNTNSEKAERS